MSAGSELVSLRGVTWSYGEGEFGLRVDDLVLGRGERVACIGPSGSGKTTLLQLIAGILVPRTGEVRLDGTTLSDLGDRERRARRIAGLGMVFQEFELLDYLSARDNVLLPYFVSEALALDDAVRARAERLAASLGIGHCLSRKPARLSQGERQRVAIARAMVTNPGLILCDEPTGNLDPQTTGTILDLLLESAAERDAGVFMVTHDHGLLERFDRVVDVRDLAQGAA